MPATDEATTPSNRQSHGKQAEHLLSLLTPAQREVVEQRRRTCEPCSQNQKLTTLSVKCEACGCAGVCLIHGRCKLRKWPDGWCHRIACA